LTIVDCRFSIADLLPKDKAGGVKPNLACLAIADQQLATDNHPSQITNRQ